MTTAIRLAAAYAAGILYAAAACAGAAWLIALSIASSQWNDGRCLIAEICRAGGAG